MNTRIPLNNFRTSYLPRPEYIFHNIFVAWIWKCISPQDFFPSKFPNNSWKGGIIHVELNFWYSINATSWIGPSQKLHAITSYLFLLSKSKWYILAKSRLRWVTSYKRRQRVSGQKREVTVLLMMMQISSSFLLARQVSIILFRSFHRHL